MRQLNSIILLTFTGCCREKIVLVVILFLRFRREKDYIIFYLANILCNLPTFTSDSTKKINNSEFNLLSQVPAQKLLTRNSVKTRKWEIIQKLLQIISLSKFFNIKYEEILQKSGILITSMCFVLLLLLLLFYWNMKI